MSRLIAGAGVSLKPKKWMKGSNFEICLVSDPKVFGLFGREIAAALRGAGHSVVAHLLPEGEAAKSWAPVQGLMQAMLKAGLGRDGVLLALGGGAVTDAAGFAASVYLRGISWISLPTTLLGQLDSGIGGKVAINLPEGKNLVGAFHQPSAIVCDTAWLSGLPRRERVSGLAEALKYGLVFDPALWKFIVNNWDGLLAGDARAAEKVIRRGAAWKIKIVKEDERETKGRRELLNFGHTLGHALEKASGYGVLRHGEAVVWGMRAALRLSGASAPGAEEFLANIPVPLPKGLKARDILEAARSDKKARRGRLRFVLLQRLGAARTGVEIPDARILEVIEGLL